MENSSGKSNTRSRGRSDTDPGSHCVRAASVIGPVTLPPGPESTPTPSETRRSRGDVVKYAAIMEFQRCHTDPRGGIRRAFARLRERGVLREREFLPECGFRCSFVLWRREFASRGLDLVRICAIVSLALVSTGCFAWIRSVQSSVVCKPDAARTAGRDDALSGEPPQESYGAMCGVAETSLNRMYQEAYEAVDEQSRGSQRGLLPRFLR